MSLLAPGSSIYSSIPGSTFEYLNGTSMAAPHVAGAWAEIKSRFPNASVAVVLAALKATGVLITDVRIPSVHEGAKPRIRILSAANWLGATRTSLTSSASQVKSGKSITLTATIKPRHTVGSLPGGMVVFKVKGQVVATRAITGSPRKVSFSAKITGAQGSTVRVLAFYQGAGAFVKSHSTQVSIKIK